jgi:cysteine desulfuration protein SufE
MSTVTAELPPRLQEIIDDFQLVEGEEKLELLLEYAESMPPLPERLYALRDQMEPVHECMSPVYLLTELHDGRMYFFFDIPPEAPTVRGYAAILREGIDGTSPEQVLAIPQDFFFAMGIHKVLSPNRLNGITALLAYMKRQTVRLTEQAA